MKRFGVWVVLLAMGLVPVCLAAPRGTTMIHGTQPGSKIAGQATLVPTAAGLNVSIRITDAPPGVHGLHFHETGDCANVGNAAGGHFNPDNVKHGFLPKDGFTGAHAGDLGNITVDQHGVGVLELTIPGLTLDQGPHGVAGRAIILHEKADDFGQPTGNAGSRIGCGIIGLIEE